MFKFGLTGNLQDRNSNQSVMIRKARFLAGVMLGLHPVTTVLAAEEGYSNAIEEVVVTARRREEKLKDVPISLTALSANALKSGGVARLRDIEYMVPNLIATGPSTNGRPDFVIRGIASGNNQPGFEQALAIYIDGVYMGRETSANPDLVDIERVEVLRGPQGTLYGKNSVSGAINITTVKPGNEFNAKANLDIGNYDLVRFTGSVSAPIVEDKLFIKLSGFNVDRDGYTVNVNPTNGGRFDEEDANGARLALRATPTDNLEINFSVDGMREDRKIIFQETDAPSSSGAFVPGFYTVNFDALQYEDRSVKGAGLSFDYGLASGHRLTSITGYRESSIDVPADADGAPLDFATTGFSDAMDQFTQEFRWTSPIGGALDYVVGLFYYDATNTSNHDAFTGSDHIVNQFFGIPSAAILNDVNINTTSYAAFANANWHVTDRLTVLLGGRYTNEKKKMDYSQTPDFILTLLGFADIPLFQDSISEGDFSPLVGLSFAVNDLLTVYGKASRGFKSGGWTTELISAVNVGNLSFDSENLTNYEFGAKGTFLDNRLFVSTSLFFMDYSDIQVVQRDPITTFNIFTNAGKASSEGIEIEFLARPIEGLDIAASFGYADAKFDDFKNCSVTLTGFKDCDGNRLNRAPKTTGNASIQYTFTAGSRGDLVLRGEYAYRGAFFFNAQNDPGTKVPSIGVFNARIGYVTDKWDVFIWGKNLNDELILNGRTSPSLVGDSIVTLGAPRTYGVGISARF